MYCKCFPKIVHEWEFSNDDFSSFTNLKLKYLAAIDEKYIHELSKDMFEMENTLIAKDGLLDKMTYERWIVINQYKKSKEKGSRYKRDGINKR